MNSPDVAAALHSGAPDAAGQLYDAHAEALFQYCWLTLRNRRHAQTAVCDALVQAGARVAELSDPGTLRAWLFTLARAECHRHPLPSLGDTDEPIARPEQQDAALRIMAWNSVMSLDLVERQALDLNTRHGMTPPEIGLILSLPLSGITDLLACAKETLERALGAEILVSRDSLECPGRTAAIHGWTGTVTPAFRDRLLEHASSCGICRPRLPQNVSAGRIFGLLPTPSLDADARSHVITRVSEKVRAEAADSGPELAGPPSAGLSSIGSASGPIEWSGLTPDDPVLADSARGGPAPGAAATTAPPPGPTGPQPVPASTVRSQPVPPSTMWSQPEAASRPQPELASRPRPEPVSRPRPEPVRPDPVAPVPVVPDPAAPNPIIPDPAATPNAVHHEPAEEPGRVLPMAVPAPVARPSVAPAAAPKRAAKPPSPQRPQPQQSGAKKRKRRRGIRMFAGIGAAVAALATAGALTFGSMGSSRAQLSGADSQYVPGTATSAPASGGQSAPRPDASAATPAAPDRAKKPAPASAAAGEAVGSVKTSNGPNGTTRTIVTKGQGSHRTVTVALTPTTGASSARRSTTHTQAAARLTVSPADLNLDSGSSGTVTLSASGGPLSWTASASSSQVSVSPSAGRLSNGGSATITISVQRQGNSGGSATVSINGAQVSVTWAATTPPPSQSQPPVQSGAPAHSRHHRPAGPAESPRPASS